MKGLYVLHLLALVVLLLLGGYFMYEWLSILEPVGLEPVIENEFIRGWEESRHQVRSKFLIKIYGVYTLCFFAFSAFVGWKTKAKLPKTGVVLILGGVLGIMQAGLMIDSPSESNLPRIFPIWLIYGLVVILWNTHAILNSEEISTTNYRDEILDEGMEE